MQKQAETSKYVKFVASGSVILNVLFAMHYLHERNNGECGLSWSWRAAAEAEAATSLKCSGHGRAYLDGLIVDGKATCECNLCYGGPDCSQFLADQCYANADDGDPYFLEPFWMEHAASSTIVVSGWYRMSYYYPSNNHDSVVSEELVRLIRKLHETVGNAATDGKFIVLGGGATHLLNAAVHSLSPQNSSIPARVVASAPYYSLYEGQTEYFATKDFGFQGEAAMLVNDSSANRNGTIIEFVTSPNNPDGQLNHPSLHGPNIRTIHDRAYYWPHFTAIPAPADEDLTIFTISKLTGHAGSRFGWALVKDEQVYERMMKYMRLSTVGVSRETQLRALKLLSVVLEDGGREIFEFGYKRMKGRWERLRHTFSLSNRFSLQKIPSHYCNFFHSLREPTPAFAWVKCEKQENRSCYDVFKSANIVGRPGKVFGADDPYVRLSLIKSDDDFDILIEHLNLLLRTDTKPVLCQREKQSLQSLLMNTSP